MAEGYVKVLTDYVNKVGGHNVTEANIEVAKVFLSFS